MSNLIDIDQFMSRLKSEGLVIGPEVAFGQQYVKGMPIEVYRRQVKQKKMLTCKQISDARLWGDLCKKSVYQIAVKMIKPENIIKSAGYNGRLKIGINAVKKVALMRGITW